MKSTYRKPWARNLLMWSDLTLGPVAKLKVFTTCLLLKDAVYLRSYVSCPFPVDTSCIWPQMRPWSSFVFVLAEVVGLAHSDTVVVTFLHLLNCRFDSNIRKFGGCFAND